MIEMNQQFQSKENVPFHCFLIIILTKLLADFKKYRVLLCFSLKNTIEKGKNNFFRDF